MDVDSIVSDLERYSSLDLVFEQLQKLPKVSDKQASRALFEKASNAIQANNVDIALRTVLAGFALDESRFLAQVQKHGFFRLSRYDYRMDCLQAVQVGLATINRHLPVQISNYLRSIGNVYLVSADARRYFEDIRNWLGRYREEGVKMILAAVEYHFILNHCGKVHEDKRHRRSDDQRFYSVEEISSAASLVLAVHGTEFGPLRSNAALTSWDQWDVVWNKILVFAANLVEFRSWELHVDRLGFTFDKVGEEFILHPPSLEFLRSIEIGYIETRLQRLGRSSESSLNGPTLLSVGADISHALDRAGRITLQKSPVERYRFELPAEVFSQLPNLDFLESERVQLELTALDLVTPIAELLTMEVKDGITFLDLFKIVRVATVWWSLLATKLVPEFERYPHRVLQSLILSMEPDRLAQLLGEVLGEDKAAVALEMLATDLNGYVDLQYRPLVRAGRSVLIPTAILANSNLYRNQLQSQRIRIYQDGTVDPVTAIVCDKLKKQRLKVTTAIKFPGGEADVVAFGDDTLFVFECKNSLLPTDTHELLTSFDHISKAESQLDGFGGWLKSSKAKAILSSKLGCVIADSTSIVTCIVISNRMFQGLKVGSHAVRGLFELIGFVESGLITFGSQSMKLWEGDCFSAQDLTRFIADDLTYRHRWQAMEAFNAEYIIGNSRVLVERMYMDSVKAAEICGFQDAKRILEEQEKRIHAYFNSHSVGEFYRTGGRIRERSFQRDSLRRRKKILERKQSQASRRTNKRSI